MKNMLYVVSSELCGVNVKEFYLLLYSIALRTLSLSPVNE